MKHPRYPRKVYAIKHNVTDRVYVESTSNVELRLKSHLACLRAHKHSVEDMQADFDRYGEDFTLEILDEICGLEDRNKEFEWMKKLGSYVRGKGYNYKDHAFNHEVQQRPRQRIKRHFSEIYRSFGKNINDDSVADALSNYLIELATGLTGLKISALEDGNYYFSGPRYRREMFALTKEEKALCYDFLDEIFPIVKKYAKIAIEMKKKRRLEK